MTDLVAKLAAALDETEQNSRRVHQWDCDGLIGVGGEYGTCDCGEPDRQRRIAAAHRTVLDLHGPDRWSRYSPPGQRKCVACLTSRFGYADDWEPDPWPCPTVLAVAAGLGVEVEDDRD